ncbi:hypothetical protein EV1_030649 [Malus domestica]
MTEGTFALVEILHGNDAWLPAYDDDDFCLCFKWSRPAKLSTKSQATIERRIPQSVTLGIYRIICTVGISKRREMQRKSMALQQQQLQQQQLPENAANALE